MQHQQQMKVQDCEFSCGILDSLKGKESVGAGVKSNLSHLLGVDCVLIRASPAQKT